MPRLVVKATRRGINNATKRLQPEELYIIAKSSLTETLAYLKDIVVANTPRNTGQTAEGIYTEVNGTSIKDLHGIVTSKDASFSILEYGRTPGGRMPPPEPIEQWAMAHGIDPDKVFPIQRAIARRGLPALHIMENALKQAPQHFKVVYLKKWMDAWGP